MMWWLAIGFFALVAGMNVDKVRIDSEDGADALFYTLLGAAGVVGCVLLMNGMVS